MWIREIPVKRERRGVTNQGPQRDGVALEGIKVGVSSETGRKEEWEKTSLISRMEAEKFQTKQPPFPY